MFPIFGSTTPSIGAAVSGGTANRILYVDSSGNLAGSTSLTYDDSTKRLTVGTGAGGLTLGTQGSTSGIWNKSVTPSGSNAYIIGDANDTYVQTGASGGSLYLQPGGTTKLTLTNTAGLGLSIAAGTAASAVSLLSGTQTRNFTTSATDYVSLAFTTTATHASDNYLNITDDAASVFSVGLGGNGIFAGTLNATGVITTGGYFRTTNGNAYWSDGSVIGTGVVYGFSSTTSGGGGADAAISRGGAAGVVAVGTGAAGSVAGQLHAGMLQASLGTALTLTQGAIGMSKMTASGSAPGASGLKLEVVCGTNAGTAKITALAGTSTTAVTVLDNIGAGVTGC